jgi:hypothetical protein
MSTITNIGIPGVGTGILHPKQKNRWRITFANLGGGSDSQPVSMQATKVSRPKFKHDKVTLHRYNSISYVASKHSFDPINLTLEDDVTSSASTVVQAQLQKQQWVIGAEGQWLAAAGEGSLYKFVMYLDQLDGNDQVIEKWIIEGCWIESCDWGDVSYDSGDAIEISLTISIDNARQILGGYTGPGIATGGVGTH